MGRGRCGERVHARDLNADTHAHGRPRVGVTRTGFTRARCTGVPSCATDRVRPVIFQPDRRLVSMASACDSGAPDAADRDQMVRFCQGYARAEDIPPILRLARSAADRAAACTRRMEMIADTFAKRDDDTTPARAKEYIPFSALCTLARAPRNVFEIDRHTELIVALRRACAEVPPPTPLFVPESDTGNKHVHYTVARHLVEFGWCNMPDARETVNRVCVLVGAAPLPPQQVIVPDAAVPPPLSPRGCSDNVDAAPGTPKRARRLVVPVTPPSTDGDDGASRAIVPPPPPPQHTERAPSGAFPSKRYSATLKRAAKAERQRKFRTRRKTNRAVPRTMYRVLLDHMIAGVKPPQPAVPPPVPAPVLDPALAPRLPDHVIVRPPTPAPVSLDEFEDPVFTATHAFEPAPMLAEPDLSNPSTADASSAMQFGGFGGGGGPVSPPSFGYGVWTGDWFVPLNPGVYDFLI